MIDTINDIALTKDYSGFRGNVLKHSINKHIEEIYKSVFIDSKDNNVEKFNLNVYEELVDKICYERISNYNDYENCYDSFSEDRNNLYKKIIRALGNNFDSKNLLMLKTIDLTVDSFIRSYVYKEFHKNDSLSLMGEQGVVNPWIECENILLNQHVIYYFTDELEDFKNDFVTKNNKSESVLTKNSMISVLAKGNSKKFTQPYFIRDTFALKNLLINYLDENNHTSSNPIQKKKIIEYFRQLGIQDNDLTNSNISNWIIKPLKANIAIGSNTNGYFLIRDENDLYESYRSHYSNFRGYINTLDRHLKKAENNDWDSSTFSKHN